MGSQKGILHGHEMLAQAFSSSSPQTITQSLKSTVEDIEPDVVCCETALRPLSGTVPGTNCCSNALRLVWI